MLVKRQHIQRFSYCIWYNTYFYIGYKQFFRFNVVGVLTGKAVGRRRGQKKYGTCLLRYQGLETLARQDRKNPLKKAIQKHSYCQHVQPNLTPFTSLFRA